MPTPIHILVIDDNETDNLISQRIIEHHLPSARINCCTSVRQAVEYMESAEIGKVESPDLIFLDIEMPVLSGAEFLAYLDQKAGRFAKDPRVVLLSSYEKARNPSFSAPRILDYLTKPLSTQAFDKVLKSLAQSQLKVA